MNNFIPFIEAYNIVKKLNIKNTNEWREWIKKNKQCIKFLFITTGRHFKKQPYNHKIYF